MVILTLAGCLLIPDSALDAAIQTDNVARDSADDTSVDTSVEDTGPFDADDDGYAAEIDCDDNDGSVNPGANEDCDTDWDDNCNGANNDTGAVGCDVFFHDVDGDGYGAEPSVCQCDPDESATTLDGTDCDDLDADVHPGVVEVCNDGVDNNCDAVLPEYDGAEQCTLDRASVGDADFRIVGAAAGDRSGAAIAAGDVNGDGVDDLVIGAPGYAATGAAFLYLGGVDFEATAASRQALYASSEVGSEAGAEVLVVDINNDTYADVLISAPSADTADGPAAGGVYLVVGQASPSDETLVTPWFAGTETGDSMGASLGSADVDNDGLQEILVGSDGGDHAEGAVWLLIQQPELPQTPEWIRWESAFGPSVVAGAGDVDGDGLDDLLVGTPDPGTEGPPAGSAALILGDSALGLASLADADTTFGGGSAAERIGASVSTAGDANWDGHIDFLIGVPHFSCSMSEGAAFLVSGGAVSARGEVSLLGLGDQVAQYCGESPGAKAGQSVAPAGRVVPREDAYDDFLVGAPGRDYSSGDAEADDGAVYFVPGGVEALFLVLGQDTPEYVGEAAGDALGASNSLSAAGDVTADGYLDFMMSSSLHDDTEVGADAGTTYLFLDLNL